MEEHLQWAQSKEGKAKKSGAQDEPTPDKASGKGEGALDDLNW